MTHVFINKENPRRIKMIKANSMDKAFEKLNERLIQNHTGELKTDYEFGYFI